MRTVVLPLVVARALGAGILALLLSLVGFALRQVVLANGVEDSSDNSLGIANSCIWFGLIVAFIAFGVVGLQLLLAQPE